MPLNATFRETNHVKFWVIFGVHPQKVIAKERTFTSNGRAEIMEGSLADIRIRLRSKQYIHRIPCENHPQAMAEKIIEIWY